MRRDRGVFSTAALFLAGTMTASALAVLAANRLHNRAAGAGEREASARIALFRAANRIARAGLRPGNGQVTVDDALVSWEASGTSAGEIELALTTRRGDDEWGARVTWRRSGSLWSAETWSDRK